MAMEPIFRAFSSWKTESLYALYNFLGPHFSLPRLLTIVILICFYEFEFNTLDTSYKWNQIIFAFVPSFFHFSILFSTFIHVVACVWIAFLRLNIISLYTYTIFIESSIWIAFHLLYVVNDAVVNVGMHLSLWGLILILLNIYPKSAITGWYSLKIFVFVDTLAGCFAIF